MPAANGDMEEESTNQPKKNMQMNKITIEMDAAQLLYYLEGCARGSHLRQGCWRDMIRLYPKMSQDMRDFLYTYAKRDIAPYFTMTYADGLHRCGAEDFNQFLACFDRDNRYMVTATDGERTETKEAYLYNGRYHTGAHMYYDAENITAVERVV